MIELPSTSVGTFANFLSTRQDIIFKYVLREVETAVDEKKDKIVLFKFSNSDTTVSLEENRYLMAVSAAMNFFTEQEMYEKAIVARDLINVLNRQNVDGLLSELF